MIRETFESSDAVSEPLAALPTLQDLAVRKAWLTTADHAGRLKSQLHRLESRENRLNEIQPSDVHWWRNYELIHRIGNRYSRVQVSEGN